MRYTVHILEEVTLAKYRPFLKERKDANNLHTTDERDASKTYAIFKTHTNHVLIGSKYSTHRMWRYQGRRYSWNKVNNVMHHPDNAIETHRMFHDLHLKLYLQYYLGSVTDLQGRDWEYSSQSVTYSK